MKGISNSIDLSTNQQQALNSGITPSTVEVNNQWPFRTSDFELVPTQWTLQSNPSYSTFPWVCDINLTSILPASLINGFPIAYFPPRWTEVLDGTIAPAVNLNKGKIRLYAKSQPSNTLKVNFTIFPINMKA